MSDVLVRPYGGELKDLMLAPGGAESVKSRASAFPTWDLSPRQLCDLELLLSGGFSPLDGFLGRADYERVLTEMRLADGTLWPIPITLDVTSALAASLAPGVELALRDPEGVILAVLKISDLWTPDAVAHARLVYGTEDQHHPGVRQLLGRDHPVLVGGRLCGLARPHHYDYTALRQTPAELRAEFQRLGWSKVVAFQTRNPMHRAHVELTMRAAHAHQASLLIHPVVGLTKPGDIDHYTRVRGYQAILPRYPLHGVALSLLPLAMRMAGPRETLLHAIIRRNHGCTHFIVGRDHAGPGSDRTGKPYYGPYDAQELMKRHEDELGIAMVPFQQMVYVEDQDAYMPVDEVPKASRTLDLSGTELRARLQGGREIPGWFTYPEVAAELRKSHPPRDRQGLTVFFTGFSGAGKSTIANVLLVKLLESGGRPVTLLDGDVVRKHLSSELGFSKEHRDINIRRIGYVASEITKNGGIAICAPIAPYQAVRAEVREMIDPLGGFVLVHIATPVTVCEQRDRKGLYALARAGKLANFTGVSDPYEEPTDAEVVIDASRVTPEEAAQHLLRYLESEGYVTG